MYKASLLRMGHLFRIEWMQRWKSIVAFVLVYGWILLISALLPAQNLELAEYFMPTSVITGLLILSLLQLNQLFPERNSPFQTCQLLQLPAHPLEKYVVKLSFLLLLGPVLFLAFFLALRPFLLAWCLALKGFVIYPLYWRECLNICLAGFSLVWLIVPLFVPGVFWFKKGHVLKSLLLFLILFFLVSTISSLLILPSHQFAEYQYSLIGSIIGIQVESIESFIRNHFQLFIGAWLGLIIPMALVVGYSLFKQLEA